MQSECGMCKGEVKEGDKGVECDSCSKWFHSKCAAVDPKLYVALTNFKSSKNSGLYWYCGVCNKGFLEWKTELMECKVKQATVEEELKQMKAENKVIQTTFEEELKQMRAEMENWKEVYGKATVRKEVDEVVRDHGLEGLKLEVDQLKREAGDTRKAIGENKVVVEKGWKEAL
jgi:hypothetical protein